MCFLKIMLNEVKRKVDTYQGMSKRASGATSSAGEFTSIGRVRLVLDPRRHTEDAFIKAKARRHPMTLMVRLYGSFLLSERDFARCLMAMEVSFPIPPMEEKTSGVKDPWSTFTMRSMYSLFFVFSNVA